MLWAVILFAFTLSLVINFAEGLINPREDFDQEEYEPGERYVVKNRNTINNEIPLPERGLHYKSKTGL
jgi:hypothetical protein